MFGMNAGRVGRLEDLVDPNDPRIKEDMVRIVSQWLEEQGYHATATVLTEDARLATSETQESRENVKLLRKAIIEGDWSASEVLCRTVFSDSQSFLYSIHKEYFLELIDENQFQKAFAHLTKRIKPLEALSTGDEFKTLCYLLTCKSIHDHPEFQRWPGPQIARQRLAEYLDKLMMGRDHTLTVIERQVPRQRLLTLLRQAVAYQVETSRYPSNVPTSVNTLLADYSSCVVPNSEQSTFLGHTANVKCITFVGDQGRHIASGSSDNTIKIWNTTSADCLVSLKEHTSRIWSIGATSSGSHIVSGSADGTVRLWNFDGVLDKKLDSVATFVEHSGDVYTVSMSPGDKYFATGGFDKTVRLFDISTQTQVKSFTGHQRSVSQVDFNHYGNLIVSGSKDRSVKLWDTISGACVRQLGIGAEITGIQVCPTTGNFLLVASRDNSNRLYDLRTLRLLQHFHGHQNLSRNFVTASFGPTDRLVTGGSEDGLVYVWHRDTGVVVAMLEGHRGTVFSSIWNPKQSLLLSCSDDMTIKTWSYQK